MAMAGPQTGTFNELCAGVQPALRRFIEVETHDAALAEELARQTLLRMRFGAFSRREEVEAWAFGIARRLVLAARRRSADGAH
jgi:DNA-directed RNA polymerase specialized sigma24 family protein